MGWRGILAGALALVALQTVVATPAQGRVAELFSGAGNLAQRFLSPDVPAFPPKAAKSSAKPSSSPSPQPTTLAALVAGH